MSPMYVSRLAAPYDKHGRMQRLICGRSVPFTTLHNRQMQAGIGTAKPKIAVFFCLLTSVRLRVRRH